MKIAYKRGDEPVKKSRKRKFDQEVEEFITFFVEDHNRKIRREKEKKK